MEYLDVKEGLRIVHMFNERVLEYWERELADIGFDMHKIIDLKNTYNGSQKRYKEHLKNCSDAEKRENKIIDGWGYGILEESLNKKNNEYDTLTLDNLTIAQRLEWEKIGSLLFEWGLAAHPSFA